MTDLKSTIEAGCVELARSLDMLGATHGHLKATTAMLLHNTGVVLAMLARSGVNEGMLYFVETHLANMAAALCNALELDAGEIAKIARGIDEQCAMLTADVKEAEKQTNKEGPCQEK